MDVARTCSQEQKGITTKIQKKIPEQSTENSQDRTLIPEDQKWGPHRD